jgi:putative inorganic carbon (HCO3(-)) transporter
VPLPPAVWQLLPGRGPVAAGYAMLGQPAPWLPLGLAPMVALADLGWMIPALAMYLAMRSPKAPPVGWLVWVVALVASASVLVGFAQKFTDNYYFYALTNRGSAPGFFPNPDHQSSFLLVAMALVGGMAAQAIARQPGRNGRQKALGWAALGLWLLAGVLINRSLACLALLLPLVAAVAMMLWPDLRAKRWVVPAAGLCLVLLVLATVWGPLGNDVTHAGVVAGISRADFWRNSTAVIRDTLPFGAGLGSFVDIYPRYENLALVTNVFVNHAHNEYIELVLELGVPGVLLIAAGMTWFGPVAARLWRDAKADPLLLAASLGITLELLHSMADYPLRRAAINVLIAALVALLRTGVVARAK